MNCTRREGRVGLPRLLFNLRQGGNKGFLRTVLKRSERIKDLLKKGLWNEESKIFGLPKTKITRMKVVKKTKKEEEVQDKEAPQEPSK